MRTTIPTLFVACALLACAAERDENGTLGDGAATGEKDADTGAEDGEDTESEVKRSLALCVLRVLPDKRPWIRGGARGTCHGH